MPCMLCMKPPHLNCGVSWCILPLVDAALLYQYCFTCSLSCLLWYCYRLASVLECCTLMQIKNSLVNFNNYISTLCHHARIAKHLSCCHHWILCWFARPVPLFLDEEVFIAKNTDKTKNSEFSHTHPSDTNITPMCYLLLYILMAATLLIITMITLWLLWPCRYWH